jgi:hypothetical protein
MQDVVSALIASRALDYVNAGWFFDDADEALVAGGTGAVDAGINVGNVVADRTEAEGGFEAANGVG